MNASFGQRASVCVSLCVLTATDGKRAADQNTVWRQSSEPVKMKENSLPRIVVIILCAVVFIAVLVVNALAAAGRGELK